MNEIKLSQETADAILEWIDKNKIREMARCGGMVYSHRLRDYINSLVVEDKGRQDLSIYRKLVDKGGGPLPVPSINKVDYFCTYLVGTDKNSNMVYETGEEISLRMWEEFLCSSITYTLPKGYANTVTQVYTNWLKEQR